MALSISDFIGDSRKELNCAFLFPGSGVELSGHESKFFNSHPEFCKTFSDICSGRTSVDMDAVLASEEESAYSDLQMQYFTYTFSAIIASWLISKGINPSLTGGYSMGLYGAAYASGFISFETGLDLVRIAYESIDEVYGKGRGGLCAVVGLTSEEISELVDIDRWPSISLSVVSSEASLVYSGAWSDLEEFAGVCESKGAYKTVMLKVDFPYHNSHLLKKVPELFRRRINDLDFHKPSSPLFSTFNYRWVESTDELKSEMADHLSTPISWLELLREVHSSRYHAAAECGPGLTLTQISRFVPDRIKYWNIRNIQGRVKKL